MFQGVFINLDGSTDRRSAMEGQLRRAGLNYRRFPALSGAGRLATGSQLSSGELGCFLSHAAIINAATSDAPLHVLEDDAIIPADFAALLLAALTDDALAKFDLIYTNVILIKPDEAWIDALLATATSAAGAFGIHDLRATRFAGSDSYVVTPSGLLKLQAMFATELALLSGPEWPLDHFYRRAIIRGELSAGCIFPFVTTVADANSTIGGRAAALSTAHAHDLLRRAFYVDCQDDRASLVAVYRSVIATL